jgi:chromosome segregation ATPase
MRRMSVQRMSVSAKDQDLEATAELPVLDVTAFEARQAPERPGAADNRVTPPVGAPAAAPAPVGAPAREPAHGKQLSRLEDDLRSLSNTLRDVEERLNLKGERLSQIERELESERASRAAADQRAENLNRELAATQTALSIAQSRIGELTNHVETKETVTRAQNARILELEAHVAAAGRTLDQAQRLHREMETRIAAYLETLQTHETRRGIFETLLRGLDSEVDERDVRVAQLERELAKNFERANELDAELIGRIKRIGALEAEVNKLATALTGANQELEIKERTHDELRKQVSMLTSEGATRAERIRAFEADVASRTQEHGAALRAVAEAQREIEIAKAAQRERIEALEAEHAAVRTELQARLAATQKELETRLASTQADLDSRLASTQAELTSRTAALQAAEAHQNELQLRVMRAEARVLENESQVGDQQETIARLHAELRATREKLETSDGDVRAAEELLNRIEGDLRAKTAKLDEVLKTQEEWRSTVEAARQALDERDSAIRRLENEAANSAALLDDIQHSIKRLDAPAVNGSAANANDLALPEGATRLLIRTDGDSEVVHVLGRKTTVGRTPDNDLQIDTKFISRHHAVILAAPAHTIIEDLNSTNGVMVNGRRIRRQPLKDGDMVAIGKTQFRFAVRQASSR